MSTPPPPATPTELQVGIYLQKILTLDWENLVLFLERSSVAGGDHLLQVATLGDSGR